MLTQTRLKECLHYDPETGIFIRLWAGSKRRQLIGNVSGSLQPHGYLTMMVDKVVYRAHHLAWFYVYGFFPTSDMDHVNGNRSDNRIKNLRLATRSQNCSNSKLRKDNSYGVKGVTLRLNGRWIAQIQVAKKKFYLGSFGTSEAAHLCYQEAARKLHGDFANTGKPTDFDYNDFDVRR